MGPQELGIAGALIVLFGWVVRKLVGLLTDYVRSVQEAQQLAFQQAQDALQGNLEWIQGNFNGTLLAMNKGLKDNTNHLKENTAQVKELIAEIRSLPLARRPVR
jgi:hypothetical protein